MRILVYVLGRNEEGVERRRANPSVNAMNLRNPARNNLLVHNNLLTLTGEGCA